ncbi:glycosyltransferase family 2 protein [Rhizobium sp. 60-20]|nr:MULTISPECIES: glycosyltransferase family 2 protein [unclassified Rhizobium]
MAATCIEVSSREDFDASNHQIRICVATVTRDRPKMLEALLMSYANLIRPHGVYLDFLVVENNHEKTLEHVVERFRHEVETLQCDYILERRIGIASARNGALEHAIARGYHFLAFADDDERVSASWLVELLREQRSKGLDLVGSPVRIEAFDPPSSTWQLLLLRGMKKNNESAERRCIKLRERGRSGSIKIATGSWLARLSFLRASGLRFDADLALGGGEDWKFWQEAKNLGAKTGWTPYAIVHEDVPASRMSLYYCYRRSRDHARQTSFVRRGRLKDQARLVSSFAMRLCKIVVSVAFVPIRRERALIAIAANIGSAVGLVEGAMGILSAHYRRIDGC